MNRLSAVAAAFVGAFGSFLTDGYRSPPRNDYEPRHAWRKNTGVPFVDDSEPNTRQRRRAKERATAKVEASARKKHERRMKRSLMVSKKRNVGGAAR